MMLIKSDTWAKKHNIKKTPVNKRETWKLGGTGEDRRSIALSMFAQGWSRKASLISAIAQHKSKHGKLPRKWEKIFNWIFLKTLNIIEGQQGQKESLRHCLFQNALVAFLAYLAFSHAMLKTPCKPSQLCWNACHACARAVSTTALGGETCNSIRLHRPYMTLPLFLTHWKCSRLKKNV